MDPDTFTIIGTIIVTVIACTVAIHRSVSRMDADRRASQAAADADRRAFQAGMDVFRTEMQRLAEWQARVEGRLDERGSAAD